MKTLEQTISAGRDGFKWHFHIALHALSGVERVSEKTYWTPKEARAAIKQLRALTGRGAVVDPREGQYQQQPCFDLACLDR